MRALLFAALLAASFPAIPQTYNCTRTNTEGGFALDCFRSAPPVESVESIVTRAYRDIFRREPDAGGLAYWSERLRNGMTEAELRRYFQSLVPSLPAQPAHDAVLDWAKNGHFVLQTAPAARYLIEPPAGWSGTLEFGIAGTPQGGAVAAIHRVTICGRTVETFTALGVTVSNVNDREMFACGPPWVATVEAFSEARQPSGTSLHVRLLHNP